MAILTFAPLTPLPSVALTRIQLENWTLGPLLALVVVAVGKWSWTKGRKIIRQDVAEVMAPIAESAVVKAVAPIVADLAEEKRTTAEAFTFIHKEIAGVKEQVALLTLRMDEMARADEAARNGAIERRKRDEP